MFEVVWTDPDRELVGEHRAKKEQKAKEKEKEGSTRSSLSTRASSSSSDRPFGLFGSKSLKKARSKKSSQPPPSLGPRLTLDPKGRSGGGSLLGQRPLSGVGSLITGRPSGFQLEPIPSTGGSISPSLAGTDSVLDLAEPSSPSERDRIDSVFSKWTEKSTATHYSAASIDSLPKPLFQSLGPSSFVTQSTEVVFSPRTAETESLCSRVVAIQSDGTKGNLLSPPISPTVANTLSICSVTPRTMDFPVNLIPGLNSLRQPVSPSWASSFKPNNPDAWKPPDEWECHSASATRPTSVDGPNSVSESCKTAGDEESGSSALNLQAMEKEVKRMAAAPPATILARLHEQWGSSGDPGQYQEQEMEKKRWMLSALDNMDFPESHCPPPRAAGANMGESGPAKVLVVHENKATTSYMAACYSTKQVYHLSTAPLSDQLYPNVHPLQVPSISAQPFPVAQQIFGAVHALSLPSLVPSQDIPPLLRNIHRCLSPGGILHLTVIDPMPAASTLGPHLRAWLEENLLLSLERHFRCTNPSKLLPIWLADAQLRAARSTITTAKFLAVAGGGPEYQLAQLDGINNKTNKSDEKHHHNHHHHHHQYQHHRHGSYDEGVDICTATGGALSVVTRPGPDMRKTLRSVVGRMLWTEVWGNYVTGDKWWWEDSACVQECIDLKTYWEYSQIEAVRDS